MKKKETKKQPWKVVTAGVMAMALCLSIGLPAVLVPFGAEGQKSNTTTMDNTSTQNTPTEEVGELLLVSEDGQNSNGAESKDVYLTVSQWSEIGVYGSLNPLVEELIRDAQTDATSRDVWREIQNFVLFGNLEIFTVTLQLRGPGVKYTTSIKVVGGAEIFVTGNSLEIGGVMFTPSSLGYESNYDNVVGRWIGIPAGGKVDGDLTIIGEYRESTTLPLGFAELEYIKSTGTQYIKTNISAQNFATDKIQVDFESESDNQTGAIVSVLSETSSATNPGNLFWLKQDDSAISAITSVNGANGQTVSLTPSVGAGKHSYEKVALLNYFDNVQKDNFASVPTFEESDVYAIGGLKTGANAYTGKIYSFKIWNGSGGLVADFVPCRNGEYVAGLFDLVGEKFYPSSNNDSAFIAGPYANMPNFVTAMGVYTTHPTNTNLYPTVMNWEPSTNTFEVAYTPYAGYTWMTFDTVPDATSTRWIVIGSTTMGADVLNLGKGRVNGSYASGDETLKDMDETKPEVLLFREKTMDKYTDLTGNDVIKFNPDKNATYANRWDGSMIKTWLNGAYLENDDHLSLIEDRIASKELTTSWSYKNPQSVTIYENHTEATASKIFLLGWNPGETYQTVYGAQNFTLNTYITQNYQRYYWMDDYGRISQEEGADPGKYRSSHDGQPYSNDYWWLRSGNPTYSTDAYYVRYSGVGPNVVPTSFGIRPCFVLDLS